MSINIIIAFLLSLGMSIFVTRVIIKFSNRAGWGDEPSEERKIHKKRIPNLGGIAVFMGTMIAYFAFSDYSNSIRPDKLFSISIFLFFIGVKDDLEPVIPWKRLFFEFICAFFIIYITDIRLTTLWGIFGIHELPIGLSYVLTSVFIVGCINAYNLIDGVDGLLASISLLGTICFGFIFKFSNEWLWTLLCISMMGSLSGFLIYNWQPSRIFMGDGGALFLGTIFACFSLRIMQLPPIHWDHFTMSAPHTLAFSIIAIPVVDMIFVFLFRVTKGISPFKADNKHCHHRLMKLGFNHEKVTIILLFANISIILLAYYMQNTGALRSLIYTFLYCSFLEFILIFLGWLNTKKDRLKMNN